MNKRILCSLGFAALAGLAVSIAIFLCQSGTGTGEALSPSPAPPVGPTPERGSNASAGRSSNLTRRVMEPEDDQPVREPQAVPGIPTQLWPARPTIYRIAVQTGGGQAGLPTGGGTLTERPGGDIEFELARGVQPPIALAAPTDGLTPAQVTVMEAVSDGFADRLVQAVERELGGTSPLMLLTTEGPVSRFVIREDGTDEGLAGVWRQEQEDADSIYRRIFGDAAYQRKHIETALKARGLTAVQPGNEMPAAPGR